MVRASSAAHGPMRKRQQSPCPDSETNSQSLSFAATNGVDYSFCVIATDDMNNQSAASATETGTARDECDFIECYPGELETEQQLNQLRDPLASLRYVTRTKV